MKKLLVIALTLCATGLYAQTTVPNGDFETNYSNGRFKGWSGAQDGYDSGAMSKTLGVNDKGAAMKLTTMSDSQIRHIASAAFELSAGEYDINVFVKGNGTIRYFCITRKGTGFGYRQTEDNFVSEPKNFVVDAKNWEKKSFKIKVSSDGTYNLNLSYTGANNDESPFVIDDITITKQ